MKVVIIAGFIIAVILIYLNRSYAYFYNFQGSHFIGNPSYSSAIYFNSEQDKEVSKLVIMGDSLMAGTGSSKAEASMAYIIAGKMGEQNLELINLAYPGVGVGDVLERQVPKAIHENPKYIILMIGTNDIHNKMTDSEFRQSYNSILKKLTSETRAKISVVNIPYIGSDRVLLVPWNILAEGRIKEFNRIIMDTAVNYNLSVIDLYGQFKNQFVHSSDFYSPDEFHPSDKGYKLWADYIYANLNR